MADGENIKNGVQLLFTAHGEKLIDLPDIALLWRVALFHIEDQGFQQIQLGVVPKVVTLSVACVLDNHVAEQLGHQFLALDLRKAVPGIGGGGRHQIEHLDGVALVTQVGAALFV